MAKKSDAKHTDKLDSEILSTTAADLRAQSKACKVAGGTTACHKLAAAADLLDPGAADAEPSSSTTATARPVGKASKAKKPAAATLADPGDTDEDDDLEALEGDEEDDLDDDDGDDQE